MNDNNQTPTIIDVNIISEFMRWTTKKTYLYTFSELQEIDGWLTREEILLYGTPKERTEFRRTTEDLFTEFLNDMKIK